MSWLYALLAINCFAAAMFGTVSFVRRTFWPKAAVEADFRFWRQEEECRSFSDSRLRETIQKRQFRVYLKEATAVTLFWILTVFFYGAAAW